MQPIDFTTDAPVAQNLDVRWIHGAPRRRAGVEPTVQVHRHDMHTYVLRQSKLVSHEAPFMYLLFGNTKALLLDTGATKDPATFPLRRTVDELVENWLADHPRQDYPLVVAHTHSHQDHVSADGQFTDRPNTVIVGHSVEEVRAHFALSADDPVCYDLGGRVLDVLATPGHHRAAITVFDPWTGWLLTGDSVYPGRLYVFDTDAYLDSVERIVELAKARPVTNVLGCHVEMTRTPRRDYPIGAIYQPNEAPLPMSVDQLLAVHEAARDVAARTGAHVFDDFIIYNRRFNGAVAKQAVRGAVRRLIGITAPGALT